MALEGSLKDFGLADIFQLICVQKKTGILKMKNSTQEAQVLFEKGLVVTADSSNLEGMKKIGNALLRSGRISEDQLKLALTTQRKTNEKLGVILVEMGAVVKEDMIKALGLQVKEAVFSLFQWKEGFYSFEPSEVSYQSDYWLPINTEFLIMEGVRRIDEWPYIKKKIPNLGLVFEKVKEMEDKVKIAKSEEDSLDNMFGEPNKEEGLQITQEEMDVYTLIDGQQDVRQLIDSTRIGDFETCKAVSNLLAAGLIVQGASVEPIKLEGEKVVGDRKKLPRISIQHTVSGIFIVFCLIFGGLNAEKAVKSIYQTGRIPRYYYELIKGNQLKQAGFSILTYFYRYNRLPDELQLLKEEHYPGLFKISSTGREILYIPDNAKGLFVLKAQD